MKLRSIIGVFMSALILSACWIGDRDDFEVQYDSTLIEVLCQTPDARTFCELVNRTTVVSTGISTGSNVVALWLGTSRIGGVDPVTGERCADGVESVFAPNNEAFEIFLDRFPQWTTIDDIPTDTIDLIVKHHIFLQKKLFIKNDDPVCTEQEIVPGNTYSMWAGGNWQFAVVSGQLAAVSNGTSEFSTNIYSPDTSTTDGIVYIIDKVLGPF